MGVVRAGDGVKRSARLGQLLHDVRHELIAELGSPSLGDTTLTAVRQSLTECLGVVERMISRESRHVR